jgi:hypothetical protein
MQRVVRALPERTLRLESSKAWDANRIYKQANRGVMAAWYEGYGAAIDWMLNTGKRSNNDSATQKT